MNLERKLEERVENILDSMGYRVLRNAKLKGRSGLYHRPDLTFEANGRHFIVECKTRFTREDIMSVYGKATDLDVSHVFLVGCRFPEIEVHQKRFDLTLLVLEESKKSERKFKDTIENVVSRILFEDEESRKIRPLLTREFNSYYFLAQKPLELRTMPIPIPKGHLSTLVVSDGLIRVDFDGPHIRVSRYLREAMKKESLENIPIPEVARIKPFLQAIEGPYKAKIVRYGLATQEAYVVTNTRFSKDKISPSEIERFILDKRGKLTSMKFKLLKQSYLYITRTPSLHLKYRGKFPEDFFKIRKHFEQLCLGR